MSSFQHRCYSNDSHSSNQNGSAKAIILGLANTSELTSDDWPFDGLWNIPDEFDDSEECTPQAGAGHLGYGDASPSDIEHTFKLAEKFEEECYQQLKQVVCYSYVYWMWYNLTTCISRMLMAGMLRLKMMQKFCLSWRESGHAQTMNLETSRLWVSL